MDNANATNAGAPPLDLDLNTVDVSRPLLADGVYDLTISKAELKSAAGGTNNMLSLEMKTTAPAKARDGADIGAGGCVVFHNIMLAPSGKSNWDMIKRNAGELVQGVRPTVPGAGLGNVQVWVPQLTGKLVRVNVGWAPAGTSPKNGKSFKEKNEVRYFVIKW